MAELPFWERKTLDQMDDDEWEALCDGCGRCCLHKLEDEDTGDLYVTRIACRLLNRESCRCTRYQDRFRHVPDCLAVRPLNEEKLAWLPSTCAYRLLHEGQPLPRWHPLISGDPDTVISAGISVAGRCLQESSIPEEHYLHYLVDWK